METETTSNMTENWQHLVTYHRTLLVDIERGRLFHKALKRLITPKSRVLDIGTGTGVWAIAAAKLGAKRIVAIEGNPGLEPIIRGTLQENCVEDKVELVMGKSWETELDDKFDVVVSETIGDLAFEEGIVNTMIDARKRFVARGGQLIPQKLTLVAAPCSISDSVPNFRSFPVHFSYLTALSRNLSYRLGDRGRGEVLAKPREILSVDLTTVETEPDYKNLTGSWKLEDASRASSFLVWARCELVPSVKLDTWKCPSWSPIVFPFDPFSAGRAELGFELSLNVQQNFWTVKTNMNGNAISRSYSPVFASMKLSSDSQLNR